MDIANLALEYLKIIIWPIFILVFICIFKKHIDAMFARIVNLRLDDKGLSLKFGTAVKLINNKNSKDEEESSMPNLSGFIFSLPDEDVLFLDKLAKQPIKDKYLSTSKSDIGLFHSLTNYGVFEKLNQSEFAPTNTGKIIIDAIKTT